MRNVSLLILRTAVASAAWLAVYSDESTKPPANGTTAVPPTVDKRAVDYVNETDEPFKTTLSGKVVALGDALKQRGIRSYAEEIKGQVVLVTSAGELVPIVPDWRGRAFYQDERLRNRSVDLVVTRRKGVPWVQILSIYAFDENGVRSIVDYWCDICAIPMFEIKDCECCQGPSRLRLRPQELHKDVGGAQSSESQKLEKLNHK